MKNLIFTISLIIIITNLSYTQTELNKDVEIIKPYKPIISDAYRYNQTPNITDTVELTKHTFDYRIESKPVKVNFDVAAIKPAIMVGEPLKKLYNTNVRFGLGNYLTPYLEINYNSLRSKSYIYGINLRHYSSHGKIKMPDDNKVYSGFSETGAKIYYKKFLKKSKVLSSSFNFARNSYNYYGYDYTDTISDKLLNKDLIEKQTLFLFTKTISLKSIHKNKTRLNYDVNLDLEFLQDINKNLSIVSFLHGNFNKFYKKEIIGLDYDISYAHAKIPTDTLNNTIVSLNPYFNKKGNNWRIRAGLNFYSNIYPDDVAYHFFPNVDVSYNVIDELLIPYIKLSGKIENNNYRKIIFENPYIDPSTTVTNSNHFLILEAGLKGKVSSNVTYNLKAKYSGVEDMYFYVNKFDTYSDTTFPHIQRPTNKFDVIYQDVDIFNFYGEIAWNKSEKLNFLIHGNYYQYNLADGYAWHKPTHKLTFTTKYSLQDKVLLNLDVFSIGKQYYVESVTYNSANKPVYNQQLMKGIIDVNIGLEYRYTKLLSGFVKLNNIANTKYQTFNYYPSQGFNALVGVSYSF